MIDFSILKQEQGSALVVALLILVVLTLLGVAATTTTTVELQISGNDKLYRMAFYEADGGCLSGAELVEQNIEERDWTASNLTARGNVGIDCVLDGGGNCVNRDCYMNPDIGAAIPSDTNRHAFIPAGHVPNDPSPHTNMLIGGNPSLSTGSAVLLASGYEGMGKGAGGGGVWIVYDVRAQHEGVRNSSSRIHLLWRHVM